MVEDQDKPELTGAQAAAREERGCLVALAIFGGIVLSLMVLAFGSCFFMGAFG